MTNQAESHTAKSNDAKSLVLIGFMGSGKTEVGKRISEISGHLYPFLETDRFVEAAAESSINDIFATHGEAHFRALESKALETLAKTAEESPMILSTGGGIILSEANRRCLKNFGVVFYLSANTPTIINRLSGDTSRPLLQTPDRLQRIESLIQARIPLYESTMDIHIDTDRYTANEVAENIWELFNAME